eukprot:2477376-Rhodomonas_salina.4
MSGTGVACSTTKKKSVLTLCMVLPGGNRRYNLQAPGTGLRYAPRTSFCTDTRRSILVLTFAYAPTPTGTEIRVGSSLQY